jgi:hypothetical protein
MVWNFAAPRTKMARLHQLGGFKKTIERIVKEKGYGAVCRRS